MKIKWKLSLGLIAALLFLSACSNDEEASSPNQDEVSLEEDSDSTTTEASEL